MQEFLLNDKVITELHMKTIDLKQRTKYAKKYDMPINSSTSKAQRNIIHDLLQKQRKKLGKTKNQQNTNQCSPKMKYLLSSLRCQTSMDQEIPTRQSPKSFIKESCFAVQGIKKSIKELSETKKQNFYRTCSLVSSNRFNDNQVCPYDFDADLRFKRSPKCFISPQSKNLSQTVKFYKISNKQNINLQNNIFRQKPVQTIKQMVDRQFLEKIKKRKAICRTAPTKHLQKMNAKQQLASQYGILDEDICKVEAKIYSDMRQNRQKTIKRNKQRVGINIQKNKPFTSIQINKSTVKLLKKYNCDNMVYFNKFVTKQ